MGRILYLLGKSASGKDSVYKMLLEALPGMKRGVIYTTRPVRDGEREGVEYHFTDGEFLRKAKEEGKMIEMRTYETVAGPWSYATLNDGQFDGDGDVLLIGTLESYRKVREYFGAERVCPIYITVDDAERLRRAVAREEQQKKPNYSEVCRRFLADEQDFSAGKLKEAGIEKSFENRDLSACVAEILAEIGQHKSPVL